MSLVDLATEDNSAFSTKSVEQIVKFCGDGNLLDGSECSKEFQDFLILQSTDTLEEYAKFCLDSKFEKSGFVLQDVVNEIGRRLKFEVTNGRYSGTRNHIGFDGLWHDNDNYIVVEVKTTDAYRINLDTIVEYGNNALSSSNGATKVTVLIVVGRQDTGDLEAQVRGSRHAWSVRLISVEALLKMLFVNERLEGDYLSEQVKQILLPFEYTKVDEIVDLVFATQHESDIKAQIADDLQDSEEKHSRSSTNYESTPRALLEQKRTKAINAFFKQHALKPKKHSSTNYSDAEKLLHVSCAVSKLYRFAKQPYWYALHPRWVEFMKEGVEGYFVLACMDRNEAFAIPYELIVENLENLNRTEKQDRYHWHIRIAKDEQDRLYWNLSKVKQKIALDKYVFSFK